MIPFLKQKMDNLMDYIKLEKVQPFASQFMEIEQAQSCLSASQFEEANAQPNVNPEFPPEPVEPQEAMQVDGLGVKPETKDVIMIERGTYQEETIAAAGNKPFDSWRTCVYNALPIPNNVIPVCAPADEVILYQSFFSRPRKLVEDMTIKELLQPYHGLEVSSYKDGKGKYKFLLRVLMRMKKSNLNFDLAIICADSHHQDILFTQLAKCPMVNMKRLSEHFVKAELYGMIVKFRKDATAAEAPITRSAVDAIMFYDSASDFDHSRLKLLKGYVDGGPPTVYLSSMDTADIRIHTFNRLINDKQQLIHWDTKISELPPKLFETLLVQPNRVPEDSFSILWNEQVANAFFNWAQLAKRQTDDFVFKFPGRGSLMNNFLSFRTHHPFPDPRSQTQIKQSVSPSVQAKKSLSPPPKKVTINNTPALAATASTSARPVAAVPLKSILKSSKRAVPPVTTSRPPVVVSQQKRDKGKAADYQAAAAPVIHPTRLGLMSTSSGGGERSSSFADTPVIYGVTGTNTSQLGKRRFGGNGDNDTTPNKVVKPNPPPVTNVVAAQPTEEKKPEIELDDPIARALKEFEESVLSVAFIS